MNILRITALSLALLGACTTPAKQSAPPLDAPNVVFKKAMVVAAFVPDQRQQIENLFATEIQRRRPAARVIASYQQFPEMGKTTENRFAAFLDTQAVDLVVTIEPFGEVMKTNFDDWSDIANVALGQYYGAMAPQELKGRIGVQVVGWDVKTKRPVYAKTSEILVGEAVGVQGVTDFAVTTVSPGG